MKIYSNALKDEIIIHSQTKNNQSKSLLRLLESNKGINEVITSFPFKVNFDIDAKSVDNFDDWFNQVKSIIDTYYQILSRNTFKKRHY